MATEYGKTFETILYWGGGHSEKVRGNLALCSSARRSHINRGLGCSGVYELRTEKFTVEFLGSKGWEIGYEGTSKIEADAYADRTFSECDVRITREMSA